MSPLHVVRAGFAVWLLVSGCSDPGVPASSESPEIAGPSLAPPSGSVQYSVAPLPKLNLGWNSQAYDINDAGIIVGSTNVPVNYQRAVRWTNRTVTELGIGGHQKFPPDETLYLVQSVAYGIAPAGSIVGAMLAAGRRGAFRLNVGGGLDTLRGLDAGYGISVFYTEAFAVNGQNTAVGYSTTTGNSNNQQHAVRWGPSGVLVDLNPSWAVSSVATDINEAGWISGYAVPVGGSSGGGGIAGYPIAVVWSPDDEPSTMAGALSQKSAAFGLNDGVQVAGAEYGETVDLYKNGFANYWPPPATGPATALHPCGGPTQIGERPFSVALEISNLGRVVGWCNKPGYVPRGWTVRMVSGVPGNYQFLPLPVTGPLWIWAQPRAVNACGTVVGTGLWNLTSGPAALIWTRVNTTGPSGAPVCDQ